MDERRRADEVEEQDELLIGPLTRLCMELEGWCEWAEPLLERVDRVCERLPEVVRRAATPW